VITAFNFTQTEIDVIVARPNVKGWPAKPFGLPKLEAAVESAAGRKPA
jgi:hypothetical protein